MARISSWGLIAIGLFFSFTAQAAEQGKVTLPLSYWEQQLSVLEAWTEPKRAPMSFCPMGRKIDGVFRKGLFHGNLEATFEVLDTSGHIRVPVLDGAASLGEVKLNGKRTSLLKEGGMYTLGVERPGVYTVRLKFYWGKEQDRFARRLRFRLPQAGATELSVMVPEKDIEARLSNGALVSQTEDSKGTRLSGNLDASGLFDLSWTRKLTHKSKQAVRSEARLNVLFTIQEAIVTGLAIFDISILEGETDWIELRVPADIEVVKVDGKAVLQWQTEQDGKLKVLLRYLVEDQARVAVHFQFPIKDNKPVKLKMPLPADGTPLTGALGVQGPAGLDVRKASVKSAETLRDLPPELTEMTASPLLFGFSFTSEPQIQLAVSRHDPVELTSTLIDEIQASSLIIEDGTEVTKLKVRMRNNTEQYLTMYLPEGAILTHALIDGQPIRPAVIKKEKGEALLFPLRQSERIGAGRERFHTVRYGETLSSISNFYYSNPNRWEDILYDNDDQLGDALDVTVGQVLRVPAKKGLTVEESSFVIELAYKLKRARLGSLGSLDLVLPKMDVNTMKVIWHLYFPKALTPLSFSGNLTQYSFIRYDPFRRLRDFLYNAYSGGWAWAGGGRYKSILKQRRVIYDTEVSRKGRGEVVLAAFPLTGIRYKFRRTLLEQETPTISVSYVAQCFAPLVRWGGMLIAFGLGLLLLSSLRNKLIWIISAAALALLLILAHYFLGLHRRIIWGVDLALLVTLLRMRAGPLWNGFKEILQSPWRIVEVINLRNLFFVIGLSFVMLAVLAFPLLLSSFMAIVLFFWWRRKARQARQEVANV
ncbi:MAG: hypothetical protein JRJ87_15800 [Deltaproteobacteria bacterium]|nr:hypothetical protein [Deltaproteobacteria bacterium]